jgi:hypothetical protein
MSSIFSQHSDNSIFFFSGSLPKQNRRLAATQWGARDAATDVRSDAPCGAAARSKKMVRA